MQKIDQISLQKRQVPGFIDFMTTDGQSIWATNQDTLQKFCFEQMLPIAEIHIAKVAGIPVYAFNSVWVASLENNAIYRLDAQTHQVLAIIHTGLSDQSGEFSLAACDEAIWVASADGIVSKINPLNHQVEAKIKVLPHSYNLSFGADAIWLSNTQHGSVQRIDPRTNQVTHRISVDETPWFLSASDQFIWTLNQRHGTVSKIDPIGCFEIARIQLPEAARGDGGDIFATSQRVWVRTTHILLIEIDAMTGKILREIHHHTEAGSGAIMQCGERLWISAHDIEALWVI